MHQLISTWTPLTLAGEKTSDYAADQMFPGDFVLDEILLSVASKWIYWKQESIKVLWISFDLHLAFRELF